MKCTACKDRRAVYPVGVYYYCNTCYERLMARKQRDQLKKGQHTLGEYVK